MNEQTTGKLTEEELQQIYASWNPGDGRRLLGHIDYQDGQIERLTKEIDSLKVDPAKREELIAECHGRFQAGFPEALRFVWLERGEQFRSGFAAAIEHAFAAGRASAPEVGELERQLEAANKRLAEQTERAETSENEATKLAGQLTDLREPAEEEELAQLCRDSWLYEREGRSWSELSDAVRSEWKRCSQNVAARVRGPLLQQIAELTEKLEERVDPRAIYEPFDCPCCNGTKTVSMLTPESGKCESEQCDFCDGDGFVAFAHLADRHTRVLADRDRLAGELAAWQAELKTVQSAIRISFNGPVGTPEYRHACEMLEHIAKAEAADHSGDAAEKVEAPASEARQFVCPKCGGTEHGTRSDYSIYCLRGYALGCGWSGTWAEVEAAKGDESSTNKSTPFRCPKCDSKYFRTIRFSEGLPQLLQCKGHWNGDVIGEKYKGCSWQGTWDEVRGHGLKQQLAAERQAREAADRRATEKILELERRCNAEHHKCEAAEKRAEHAEAALKQMCDLDEETSRLERESCDARTEGIRAALDGVKREDCPHKDESKQSGWLRGHEETESMMELQRRAEQAEAAAGMMREKLDLLAKAADDTLKSHPGTSCCTLTRKYVNDAKKALALDTGRAAADELRALRVFAGEVRDALCSMESLDKVERAMAELDKTLAGQGEAGKEGR